MIQKDANTITNNLIWQLPYNNYKDIMLYWAVFNYTQATCYSDWRDKSI